jgi:uncharacterized protein
MRIAELEPKLGDFYVPAFVIKVSGEDVLRDLYLSISQVSVDLKEKAAGRFSFTVENAFDWKAGEFLATRKEERIDLLELFAFGKNVEVAVGYGGPAELAQPMLTGVVTEITTDFQAGGSPALSISGFDDLYPLTIGKGSRHWENKPDSFAVKNLVEPLVTADVRATTPVKLRIDQNNESDMAFIGKLAERNGVTFYYRDRKFYFGPRQSDKSAVVELEWGQGLLGFSPEANLSRQITEVQVHGFSATKGEVVVGKAKRVEEPSEPGTKSGGQRLVPLAADPVLHMRAAVRTQAEADARAKAVLEDRAQDFVTGSGESIGVPSIVPDTTISLRGLGRAFSRTYRVAEAVHKLDHGGYRTTFKTEKPKI